MIGKYLLGNSSVDGYLLEDGSNRLFLEFNTFSGSINLAISGASFPSITGNLDLFIRGREILTDNVNLFTNGYDIVVNDTDLFISGKELISDDITLFITTINVFANNSNLFINGNDTIVNSIDLFIFNLQTINDNKDLFINGFSPISNSIDLFVSGPLNISSDIDLFTSAPMPISSNVKVDITQVQSASSGMQDITIPDFGDVKAAILIIGNATVNGVDISGINYGIGITDGLSSRSIGFSSEENVANTNTHSIGGNHLIYLPDRSTSTVIASATFDSLITDGIRINWDMAPPENYLITAIFFGGESFQAILGTFTSSGTVGQSVDVNTGFEPDQLVTLSNGFSFALDDTVQDLGTFCIGFADNGNTLSQGLVTYRNSDNASIGSPSLVIYSGLIASRITLSSIVNSVSVSGFTPSGFVANTVISNGSTSVSYLAFKYADNRKHYVGIIDSPTISGINSFNNPLFKPLFVMQLLTQVSGINILEDFDEAGAYGLSVFTNNKEYCHSISERSSTITDNRILFDNQAINFPNHSGLPSFEAVFDSMTSDGWILNFTSVEPTGKKWLVFGIEDSSGSTSGSIDLFISGQGDFDYWNLFLNGEDNDLATSRILFIYGSPSGINLSYTGNDLDLFIKSSILDSDYPPFDNNYYSLFLKTEQGNISNNGYWTLFLNSNTIKNNDIDLYITTIDPSINDSINLFIERIPDFPGQIDAVPINDYWTLFLRVPDGSTNNIDLFINGNFASIISDCNLFVEGIFVINDSLNLILYGIIDIINNSINLFTDGIGFSEVDFNLFIRGF